MSARNIEIRIQRINILYEYLDYLTDAFLLYQAPIYARSERVRQVNPRKLYVVDTGIVGAMSVRMTRDDGALLENLVFMHLRHHGLAPDYYVTSGGAEIDFIYRAPPEDEVRLVQACWSISDPETRKREVQGLIRAMREMGAKRGTIVTWLDEETPAEGIDVVPAWKWLIQQPS